MITLEENNIVIHNNVPHLKSTFVVCGNTLSHPVNTLIHPEARTSLEEIKQSWESLILRVENADAIYRAHIGDSINICHHKVTITDFHIAVHGISYMSLVLHYIVEFNGLTYPDNKEWIGADVHFLPSDVKALEEITKTLQKNCDGSHKFLEIVNAV